MGDQRLHMSKLTPRERAVVVDVAQHLGATRSSYLAAMDGATDADRTAKLDAYKAQVKRRFRELAREWHPDVNGGDASKTERFRFAVDLQGEVERLTSRSVVRPIPTSPSQWPTPTYSQPRQSSRADGFSPFSPFGGFGPFSGFDSFTNARPGGWYGDASRDRSDSIDALAREMRRAKEKREAEDRAATERLRADMAEALARAQRAQAEREAREKESRMRGFRGTAYTDDVAGFRRVVDPGLCPECEGTMERHDDVCPQAKPPWTKARTVTSAKSPEPKKTVTSHTKGTPIRRRNGRPVVPHDWDKDGDD